MSRGQASMSSLNQSKDVDGPNEPLMAPLISPSSGPNASADAARNDTRKSLNFSNKVVPVRDGANDDNDENIADDDGHNNRPNEEVQSTGQQEVEDLEDPASADDSDNERPVKRRIHRVLSDEIDSEEERNFLAAKKLAEEYENEYATSDREE